MFPERYENTKYVPATTAIDPIASPSRPSVRFTAFDDPTITTTANTIYSGPRSITAFLKNGSSTDVLE